MKHSQETSATEKLEFDEIADFEVRSLDTICINESQRQHPWWYNFKYAGAGIFFGILLIKGEVISWFRIQEMFRFQSFHMYGVIGSAIAVGLVSYLVIRRFSVRTVHGEQITFAKKKASKGQVYGGLLFGVGWALTGACPGPLFALLGTGVYPIIIAIFSAIAGTWVYGYFRPRLPH